jgi:hypothetical protein
MKSDERYALELVGLPGWSTPTAQRVKRLVKAAARQFGLRCVGLKELGAQPVTASQPNDSVPSGSPAVEVQP